MEELTPKALIRSLPALSPSPLGLCHLCRGFPHAPFGAAYFCFVRSMPYSLGLLMITASVSVARIRRPFRKAMCLNRFDPNIRWKRSESTRPGRDF
jgi:hypothetical protein